MDRQPDLAVPLPPSIDTQSLVQIGPAVGEIWELPFFIAARLGSVHLRMIGNPTLLCPLPLSVHAPSLVQIGPAVAEIWAVPFFYCG